MRPFFIVILGICFLLAVGKFVISDFWGGISMLLVCMMGAFVLSGEHGINVTNCLFYAVMALISGIFDVMACVMYFSHSKYAIFDSKAPTMVLVAQSVFVLSPIALFASGCLSYSMYNDCRNNMSESSPFTSYDDGYGYGARDQRPPPSGYPQGQLRPGGQQQQHQQQQARPFQGQGQRLGDSQD